MDTQKKEKGRTQKWSYKTFVFTFTLRNPKMLHWIVNHFISITKTRIPWSTARCAVQIAFIKTNSNAHTEWATDLLESFDGKCNGFVQRQAITINYYTTSVRPLQLMLKFCFKIATELIAGSSYYEKNFPKCLWDKKKLCLDKDNVDDIILRISSVGSRNKPHTQTN